MKNLWKRLEAYLKKHAPPVLDFLNPPAAEREIRDAEEQLGVRFPSDLIESLRIHDGQPQETGKPPHPIPVVPQEYEPSGAYRATFGELAPLPWIVCSTNFSREVSEDLRPFAHDFEYDGPVRRDGNWSWLVFIDAGSGDQLALDLNPDAAGQIGQVVSVLHDPSAILVLAPSYRNWFETLVTRFETGRYKFVEEDGELEPIDCFGSRLDDENKSGLDGCDILRFPH